MHRKANQNLGDEKLPMLRWYKDSRTKRSLTAIPQVATQPSHQASKLLMGLTVIQPMKLKAKAKEPETCSQGVNELTTPNGLNEL